MAFLASSAGLEHEAHAYRTAGATGREIDGVTIHPGCAKVDLFDFDLQKGVFVEEGFHANPPTGSCDVLGRFGGA